MPNPIRETKSRFYSVFKVASSAWTGAAPGGDNVLIKRLWKSVKYKRVYLRAYDSVAEARTSIMQYLDWHNQSRPHSSLGGKTPDEAYAVMLPTVELAA